MATLKIPLIDTYLKIEVCQIPKVEKLKKELSDFFNKNEICGIKIKSFDIDKDFNVRPNLEGKKFYGDKDYNKDIRGIGRKYCIENLQFALYCYEK
jgi:hypothetical protein